MKSVVAVLYKGRVNSLLVVALGFAMPPSQTPKDAVSPAVKPAMRPTGASLPVAAKLPPKPGALPDDKPVDNASEPLVPPEETIWEKYSSNGESVLSGMSSFLIHLIVLLVIVTGLLSLFDRGPAAMVEELEPVEIGNGEEGGGGGSTEGVVDNAAGNLTRPMDAQDDLEQKPMEKLPEDEAEVKKSTTPTIQEDPLIDMQMEKLKKPEMQALGPVLKDALQGLAGRGKGGSGAGGGEGSGLGRGRGDGTGDGTGKTNRRGRRVLRWEMVFNTSDARNYLQQLKALDAILAVPDRSGRLMVIRDLNVRPAKPQYEDVKALNRIYWVDDRRDSADQMAAELGLDFVPSAIVAFFPVSLEQELLKKELAFKNRTEEQIEYTRFNITFSGGKPVVRVVEQRAFK